MSEQKSWSLSTREKRVLQVSGFFALNGVFFWPFLKHAFRGTAPFVPAGDSLLIKTVGLCKKYGDVSRKLNVIDLGSGNGVVLRQLALQLPQWSFHGVDNNRWLIYSSRLSALRQGISARTSFSVGNLYRVKRLDRFDVIFVCLVPKMLPDVEKMISERAKDGTLVLSARFPFPTWKPEEVVTGGPVDGLWVYKVSKKD